MRDVNKLFEDYKPLRLSLYKRYHPMLNDKEDKADLLSQIDNLFVRLVFEWDPRRGVDLPYYLKRMLSLRVHHYVTKTIGIKSKEVLSESFTNDLINYEEESAEDCVEYELIEKIASWNDDFVLGKKQKKLFEGLIRDHRPLRDMAEEEGVDVSILHTRMHFLLKKLRALAEEEARLEED